MTVLVLFATAALAGSLAGYPLARAHWPHHAPRLAVALWHALGFGVISAVVLGGLSLALPVLPQVLTGGFSDFLARCAMALREEFAASNSDVLAVAGLLVALMVLGRVIGSLVSEGRNTRRVRRAQLDTLALAGHPLPGARSETLVLLEDARPAAFCLPGALRPRRGTIVMSSGALDLLDDDQVRLVLAHERAHLRQRHHIATRMSAGLARALGWLPLFRLAGEQVPLLLEMAADDQALRDTAPAPTARQGVRHRLALTLLTLATPQAVSPSGVLAATGGSAVVRITRLSQPASQLGVVWAAVLSTGVVLAGAGPLLVASAPALCAAAMEICPFAFS